MTSSPPPPARSRRHLGLIALGFLAIAAYGSFSPFHFKPMPVAEALSRFGDVVAQPIGIYSRTDWLANFLLMVPAGFALLGALTFGRPPEVTLPAACGVLFFCCVFSMGLEFGQLFFPPRVSSLNDVVAQTTGSVAGMTAWFLLGPSLTRLGQDMWSGVERQGLAARLMPFYFLFVLIVEVLPFDFTLSPAQLYHKYRDGRIHLVPFTGRPETWELLVTKALRMAALFFPLGWLAGHLDKPVWRHWYGALAIGVGAAALVEFCQIFAVSRNVDVNDIGAGGLGALAGWFVAVGFAHPSVSARRSLLAWTAALMVWLGCLVFLNWQPFQFTLSIKQALTRLAGVSLVPFSDYLEGDYLNFLDQVIHKAIYFLPGGFLVSRVSVGDGRHVGSVAAFFFFIFISASLELGQAFLPERYPSVSDVMVETAAGWLAFRLGSRWRESVQ
jgi:VanZ family protein